jgi:hypothetical protein
MGASRQAATSAGARPARAGGQVYDASVTGRWTAVLVSLAAFVLLLVLIDGWAIAFLPRLLEKLLVLAAFLVLASLVILGLLGRDGGVFFSREDARRLDGEP